MIFKFFTFKYLFIIILAASSLSCITKLHGLICPTACGILVPRPGIEPATPALEGRFLITGLPGKMQEILNCPVSTVTILCILYLLTLLCASAWLLFFLSGLPLQTSHLQRQ